MTDFGPLGRVLILFGVVLIGFGLLLTMAPKIPGLFRLPGDIVIRREGFTFYFPLATSLLISILLSLVFYLIRR